MSSYSSRFLEIFQFSPRFSQFFESLKHHGSSRAIDGDIVVVEKLEDAEALERADKRLRREVGDPDFGKTEAQPSTTDAGQKSLGWNL